jgi:hypothetical protein
VAVERDDILEIYTNEEKIIIKILGQNIELRLPPALALRLAKQLMLMVPEDLDQPD